MSTAVAPTLHPTRRASDPRPPSALSETPEARLNLEGLAAYAAAAVATMAIAFRLGAPVGVVPIAAVAIGGVAFAAVRRWRPSAALGALALTVAAIALVQLWRGALPVRPYGDGALIGGFLEQAYIFPRWLLGMTLAVSLHAGIWRLPPVAASVPAHLATGAAFASLLCIVVMAASTIALLTRWNRLPVQFAVLTPVWLLFSSGYVEYYPLMIGVWVAALMWMFDRPLRDRHPVAVGVMVGILPAVYVALAPASALLFAAYAATRPRQALTVLAAAAATLALAISVSYPTIPAFLRQLYGEMNFGDVHSHPRYAGLAASPSSILLASRYVWRPWHLQDVAYMVFWGGGWLFLPILAAGAAVGLRTIAWRDARVWLGGGLVASQAAYVLWMIPKAGPQADVDLFCPAFVLFAVVAGLLVEGTRWRHTLLGAIVGMDVVTATYLVWAGLPPAY